MAKRAKLSKLRLRESNYNALLKDMSDRYTTNEFDINLISNGEYCFYDVINYLKSKQLYDEFKEYVANQDVEFFKKIQ